MSKLDNKQASSGQASKRRRRFGRNEDGSVAVEFAFVAPIFFAMMFGIYETGQILWTQSQINYNIDRAARMVAVDPDGLSNAAIQSEIESRLARLATGDLTVTVSRTAGTPAILRVDSSYVHEAITPLFPVRDLTLTHSAQFPLIDQGD